MLKYLAFAAALVASAFAQASDIGDYVKQHVAGVYNVDVYGLNQQPGPIRLGYMDGDKLVMDLWGKKKVVQIESVDADVGAINYLDSKGEISTLSMHYGIGTLTLDNGLEAHLTILRRLTEGERAALAPETAPAASVAAVAPVSTPTAAPAPVAAPAAPTGPIRASFDCAKASTAVEGMICGNADLAALDVDLARLYKDARTNTADQASLKQAQLAWIKQRNTCRTTECLASAYHDRASALSAN